MSPEHKAPAYFLLLFFLAVAVLLPGTGELTGITGKDEYLLGLRTPMHMLEGNHGWLPWLDGQPRLKKPPLIYWMAKSSYQYFGVSLVSARAIGVLFAALLVLLAALFSWSVFKHRRAAMLAGLVLLGMAGIMVDGRRLLLDIPVAFFSGLSVMLLYQWMAHGRVRYLMFMAISLALAFLTKGPVALLFFIPGTIALLLSYGEARSLLRQHWQAMCVALLLFMLMALPWFGYVYVLHPEQLSATLGQEWRDRDLLSFSVTPLVSMLLISLPWSPVALKMIYRLIAKSPQSEDRKPIKFFLLWLLLALLPFFFFKSFGRYLYGCLIPLSILIAYCVSNVQSLHIYRGWLRAGALLTVLAGVLLVMLVVWFREMDVILLAFLGVIPLFLYIWWQSNRPYIIALAAIAYWLAIIGFIYPRIGINAIADGLVESIRGEYVVLFAGPQPAMLPAASGQGLRATSRLWTLPEEKRSSCRGLLIFSPTEHLPMARKQMKDLGMEYQQLQHFQVLSSRGSWLRFVRKGTSLNDWQQAIATKDIDSLGIEVTLLRARPAVCP